MSLALDLHVKKRAARHALGDGMSGPEPAQRWRSRRFWSQVR